MFGLLGRIIATFPFAVRALRGRCARSRARSRYWPIALGGLFGAIGAWVDKWVVWFSPYRHPDSVWLLHAPLYDSAMFLSYLVVIPAYAAFIIHLEVQFFRNYRLFYSSILEHATLAQIRAHARRLRDETIASSVRHHGAAAGGLCAGGAVGSGADRRCSTCSFARSAHCGWA